MEIIWDDLPLLPGVLHAFYGDGRDMDISTGTSRVRVLVVRTNEELMIARDTLEVVQGASGARPPDK